VPSILSREHLLRWTVALACFGAVLFFFSPSWAAFALWARVPEMSGLLEVRRGVSVLAQMQHPGAPIADPLHQAIQWRLLFPIIGHVLHLSPALLFSLAYVGCWAALAFVLGRLRRAGWSWSHAAVAAVTLGAASWVFVSTGWLGYFDSWLALSLLIVAFADSRYAVWAAALWAPWIDERFIIALPLALLCRWIRQQTAATDGAVAERRATVSGKLEYGVPLALAALFLFVRLGLVSGKSAQNATLLGYFAGRNYLDAPASRILLGIWDGLRAGWIFVMIAVLALRRAPLCAAALGIAIVLTAAAGLATAQDYSRSMTMLLPVAVLGALELPAFAAGGSVRWLGVAAAVALLLPAHHVMNDAVNPIRYLYHELDAFASPPPAGMPELRELHAIHEMELGEYAAAEADLTLAIKLARNPASPAKQRGVLYATAHRWEEAKRDFSMVVDAEPDNPDGWFLRAQAELALHDTAAARSDFEHAKSIAPADWARRSDVARFSATLDRQAPRP
jgi:hypothetical protein